jgi:hypothetical protein
MFIFSDFSCRCNQQTLEEEGNTMNNVAERLSELDVRHGELLDKLARLDQQIDDVLKEWTTTKEVQPEFGVSAFNAS